VLPFVALLGSGAAVGLVALRWRRAGQAEAVSAGTSRNRRVRLDPALERRLDEELARFDG
jgi:hypothetical protein